MNTRTSAGDQDAKSKKSYNYSIFHIVE
jgi:hypothetical protein